MSPQTTLASAARAQTGSSASLEWQILPHLVLRHAGFPFEWLDRLAAPEASRLAADLVSDQQALDEDVRRILDRPFPAAVVAARGRDDAVALRSLSRLRSRLGRRGLRSEDVAAAEPALPPGLCAELREVCAARARLAELQERFERTLAGEDAAGDGALRHIARDPAFRAAIFLSSPDLYRNSLRRFVDGRAQSQTFRRRLLR